MDEFIKKNFNKMTKKEIANELNISYNKVEWTIRKLNLKHYKSIKYSEQEIEFIKTNYPKYGSKYCADKLNRSENAINKKIKKLGLSINWKHTYINGNGYLVNCEDRKHRYLVHRRLVENKIGRKLKNNEVVHHIDGNKLNNNINNLKLMTRKEHIEIHRKDLESGKYKI